MWELDYNESWAPKNWCFWTVVLEKTLESPLDCKEIQPVHPKGNQSWVFIGRTDAEAETPILWPPDVKNWLIWKTMMQGKTEGGRRGWERIRWLDGVIDSMDMKARKWKKVKSLHCLWLFVTPWAIAYQALPPMGFFQARILEWVAISFSRRSSNPGVEPGSPGL